jgi:hypothetical protein
MESMQALQGSKVSRACKLSCKPCKLSRACKLSCKLSTDPQSLESLQAIYTGTLYAGTYIRRHLEVVLQEPEVQPRPRPTGPQRPQQPPALPVHACTRGRDPLVFDSE